MSLADAMRQCNVSEATLRQWMKEPEFQQAIRLQLRIKQQEGRIVIERSVPKAANKLIELLNGKEGKEETARKACLDILSLGGQFEREAKEANDMQNDGIIEGLSDEAAEKILQALSEGEDSEESEMSA
jgi:hypothetical protein